MTHSIDQTLTEIQRAAGKHIATPVSYSGGKHAIWPRAANSGAWGKLGWGTLLALYWFFVTTWFYAVIFCVPVFLFPWFWYTQARRHRIRAAREVIALRAAPSNGQPPTPSQHVIPYVP